MPAGFALPNGKRTIRAELNTKSAICTLRQSRNAFASQGTPMSAKRITKRSTTTFAHGKTSLQHCAKKKDLTPLGRTTSLKCQKMILKSKNRALREQIKKNAENQKQRMETIKSKIKANPNGKIDGIEALGLDTEEAFHDCVLGEAEEGKEEEEPNNDETKIKSILAEARQSLKSLEKAGDESECTTGVIISRN